MKIIKKVSVVAVSLAMFASAFYFAAAPYLGDGPWEKSLAGVFASESQAAYTAKLVTNPKKVATYSRMMTDIKQLKAQYPGLVNYSYIGKSLAGVNIPLVTLGKGPKKILVVAAMHGNEHITTAQAMYAIDNYAYYYAKNKKFNGMDVRRILDEVTYYFVPMSNPDGTAISISKANAKQKSIAVKTVGGSQLSQRIKYMSWKGNARSANLNRNFPANWADQESGTRNTKSIDFGGRSGGSEPETKALMKLCLENEFACMITTHVFGQQLFWKDIYTGNIPGAAKLKDSLKSTTGYKPEYADNDRYGGRFEQWFRYTFNRPAVLIEMMPGGYGLGRSYTNFQSICWSKTKTAFLKAADCGSVTTSYRLYFDYNKGSEPKNKPDYKKDVKTGKAVGSLPTPTRKGYKFDGWYTGKTGGKKYTKETVYEPNKNTQLYAHWKKI